MKLNKKLNTSKIVAAFASVALFGSLGLGSMFTLNNDDRDTYAVSDSSIIDNVIFGVDEEHNVDGTDNFVARVTLTPGSNQVSKKYNVGIFTTGDELEDSKDTVGTVNPINNDDILVTIFGDFTTGATANVMESHEFSQSISTVSEGSDLVYLSIYYDEDGTTAVDQSLVVGDDLLYTSDAKTTEDWISTYIAPSFEDSTANITSTFKNLSSNATDQMATLDIEINDVSFGTETTLKFEVLYNNGMPEWKNEGTVNVAFNSSAVTDGFIKSLDVTLQTNGKYTIKASMELNSQSSTSTKNQYKIKVSYLEEDVEKELATESLGIFEVYYKSAWGDINVFTITEDSARINYNITTIDASEPTVTINIYEKEDVVNTAGEIDNTKIINSIPLQTKSPDIYDEKLGTVEFVGLDNSTEYVAALIVNDGKTIAETEEFITAYPDNGSIEFSNAGSTSSTEVEAYINYQAPEENEIKITEEKVYITDTNGEVVGESQQLIEGFNLYTFSDLEASTYYLINAEYTYEVNGVPETKTETFPGIKTQQTLPTISTEIVIGVVFGSVAGSIIIGGIIFYGWILYMDRKAS